MNFQQTDKVPSGAMQIGVRQQGGPSLGGQFAMGGQPASLVPPMPQMPQMQQQAQISSPSMPKGAQPVVLAGSMPAPQLGSSAAAVPQRLASQGIQAPAQPFFRPQVLPGPQQQQVPQLGHSQFQPQQFAPQPTAQPQYQPQYQQPAPAPAPAPSLGQAGMEVRTILVEGIAPDGQKYTSIFESEFPRGTKLLGAREVAGQQ